MKIRGLFRFSLLSFFLIVSLVCMSVSHYLLVQENGKLDDENRQLKKEVGYIEVADPKKAYVLPLESPGPLIWRFRVYLPSGSEYRIRTGTYWIAQGFPERTSRGSGPRGNNDQFIVTVSLFEDANGWGYRVAMPGRGQESWQIRERNEEVWISDRDANRSSTVRGRVREFDPAGAIEIMRWQAYPERKGEAADHGPGFMVWLDPNPAHTSHSQSE